MLGPNTEGRTSSSASTSSTERSALLKKPDLKVAYGTDISRSDNEYGSSDGSSLSSRSVDEEASVDSNVTPGGTGCFDTHEPLSSRAILWTVLPMLLGESRYVSRGLNSSR